MALEFICHNCGKPIKITKVRVRTVCLCPSPVKYAENVHIPSIASRTNPVNPLNKASKLKPGKSSGDTT